MSTRVLVTSSGSAPSNNVVRSLRAGPEPVFVAGCHDDQFVLKNSAADKNYLVPPVGHPNWARALRHILEAEAIQTIIPTIDSDVTVLSQERKWLHRYLLLPSAPVVETCQDKYSLYAFLHGHGLDVAATRQVDDPKSIPDIFRQLGDARPLWCRARTGAGGLGALPVRTPEHARSWIRYWGDMRGMQANAFILSEYLPGRDFGCQSVWKDGEMILLKTYERLSYLGTGSQPAEGSSIAALAKTVIEPRVADACVKAIHLLDRRASGVFSVDLKENAKGVPCITEINIGRFSSATNIVDLVGRYNMATIFVRLATGQPVELHQVYDATEDWYMLRDIDSAPNLFHAADFFDNITDTLPELRVNRTNNRRAKRGEMEKPCSLLSESGGSKAGRSSS
jgi:biotin carboxylase